MDFRRAVFGGEALDLLLKSADVSSVLDIGSGSGQHAIIMRENGKRVVTNSLKEPANVVGDYLLHDFKQRFSAIWASHVLEHQPNVHLFLKKCFADLAEDGILAVTVPPLKHEVVGGHLNLFNSGTLLYNLILAGFDCRNARVSPCYVGGPLDVPYNLSVLVRKKKAILPALAMDHGDIERLAEFFPMAVCQGFNGQTVSVRWGVPL